MEDVEEETSKKRLVPSKFIVDQKLRNWLEFSLPDLAPVTDANHCRKLKRNIDNHLLLNKNKQHARYKFSKHQHPTSEKLEPKQNGEYYSLTITVT